MSNIQVIFNSHVDRSQIEAAIADSIPYPIDIINNYSGDLVVNYSINANDLDAGNLESLLKIADVCSYEIEKKAYIWIVENAGKTFTLSNSYQRNDESTMRPMDQLPEGLPIRLRFEIPGFRSNNFREIDLWYGLDFNPVDIASLAEIGIELTGNGTDFSILNDTECKMSFSKPEVTSDTYIIDFAGNNVIIDR